jgi:hypothetical protein
MQIEPLDEESQNRLIGTLREHGMRRLLKLTGLDELLMKLMRKHGLMR